MLLLYLDQREDNLSLIEEAAAIKTVMKLSETAPSGDKMTASQINVEVLSELQDRQDWEIARLLSKVKTMVTDG